MSLGTFLLLLCFHCVEVSAQINGVGQTIVYGKILPNVSITTKKGISYICCTKACVDITRCQSINYFPPMRVCQINSKMHVDENDLLPTKHGIYARKDDLNANIPCENPESITSLIDCGVPTEQANATLLSGYSTGIFSKAIYTCNTGYVMDGPAVIGCKEDGSWNYRKFQCNKKPPEVNIEKDSYSVIYGNDIEMTCNILSYHGVDTISWRHVQTRGFADVKAYTTLITEEPHYTAALTIFNAGFSDEGSYVCLATSGDITTSSTSVNLTVLGDVPTVEVFKTSLNVVRNDIITLPCSILAIPGATSASWFYYNQDLNSLQAISSCRYSGGNLGNPNLTMINVQPSDEGFYLCSATNILGTGYSKYVYISVTQDSSNMCAVCPASYTCDTNGNPYICYRHYEATTNVYSYAYNLCCSDGAELVRIDSADKQMAVQNILDNYASSNTWIQGKRDNTVWKFDNGSKMLYTNWYGTQGQNADQTTIFIVKNYRYHWFDRNPTTALPSAALCEYMLT